MTEIRIQTKQRKVLDKTRGYGIVPSISIKERKACAMISGNASEKRVHGMVLGAVLLGIAAISSAYGDAVLWHHFDERAPGETAQASDVFTNSVSESYGSGRAYSINTGTTLGNDPDFMPKFVAPMSSAIDLIYDPVSGAVHTNRSAISFRTEGTESALAGGAVVIGDDPAFRLPSYTVECFVCTTGGTFNLIAPIVGKICNNAFTSETWQMGVLGGGKMFIRYNQQPSSTSGAGTHKINDGLWHHIALTCSYDATENKSYFKMYVDYELDFTASRADAPVYGTREDRSNDIFIGGYMNAGRKFNGMIDELRITDAALTQDQFLRRRAPVGDGDALVWLPLDGPVGETVAGSLNSGFGPMASITVKGDVQPATYSGDVVSHVVRTDISVAPTLANETSIFFQTNGISTEGSSIHLPSYAYTATNLTAEMFFKTADKMKPGTSQTLLKISDTPYLQLTLDNVHPGMFIVVYSNVTNENQTGKWTSFNAGSNLDDGTWHHVALVYDAEGHTLKTYIDYVLRNTQRNVVLPNRSATTAIGSTPLGNDQHFHGWIDSVRITQRALGPSEFLIASSKVYDLPADTAFYFSGDGDFEAFSGGYAIVGNGLVHEKGNALPAFSSEVRYAELLHDGEGGSNIHTNEGSVYMDGSIVHFPSVFGLGNYDQTAEFFGRFTSIPKLAGLLRVNASPEQSTYGTPVWALYGENVNLNLRCSTVTNGVVNTERYFSTLVPSSSVCDDKWHHFALTFQAVDGGTNTLFTMYIDGEQRSQLTIDGQLHTSGNGNGVAVGAAAPQADGAITGYIDEVRISRGILPPSRFLRRYKRPRGLVIGFK